MKTVEIAISCVIGSCPAIFKTDKQTHVIVGKLIKTDFLTPQISKRINHGEVAIEVPNSIFEDYIERIRISK